jgi:hypothetical protein
MDPEPEMELEAEDIIALYLLEHPEDEDGVGTATFGGIEEQMIKGDVLRRLAQWGIEKGYFDEERVQRDIGWMEKAREDEEEA